MESELKGEGGMIRYSGTQSMCRIMVEGPTAEITERCAAHLAGIVRTAIG